MFISSDDGLPWTSVGDHRGHRSSLWSSRHFCSRGVDAQWEETTLSPPGRATVIHVAGRWNIKVEVIRKPWFLLRFYYIIAAFSWNSVWMTPTFFFPSHMAVSFLKLATLCFCVRSLSGTHGTHRSTKNACLMLKLCRNHMQLRLGLKFLFSISYAGCKWHTSVFVCTCVRVCVQDLFLSSEWRLKIPF